jgi:hypothetical protein
LTLTSPIGVKAELSKYTGTTREGPQEVIGAANFVAILNDFIYIIPTDSCIGAPATSNQQQGTSHTATHSREEREQKRSSARASIYIGIYDGVLFIFMYPNLLNLFPNKKVNG